MLLFSISVESWTLERFAQQHSTQFSRGFKNHGPEHLSTYLIPFKVGEFVDVKANASIHRIAAVYCLGFNVN